MALQLTAGMEIKAEIKRQYLSDLRPCCANLRNDVDIGEL